MSKAIFLFFTRKSRIFPSKRNDFGARGSKTKWPRGVCLSEGRDYAAFSKGRAPANFFEDAPARRVSNVAQLHIAIAAFGKNLLNRSCVKYHEPLDKRTKREHEAAVTRSSSR